VAKEEGVKEGIIKAMEAAGCSITHLEKIATERIGGLAKHEIEGKDGLR
jgi:uncharacterized Fe-S cluster-containing protein